MQSKAALSLCILPAALLGGCASADGKYPSLAIRDAERVSGSFTVPEAPSPAPLPADTLDRVEQLQAAAASAHQAFSNAVPEARSAVSRGRGAASASKAWSDAEIALADLVSQRSHTAIVLADLDLLLADTTLAFERRAKVDEARNAVLALIREEDRILAELSGARGT